MGFLLEIYSIDMIKKYDLMPYLEYDKDTVEMIAAYIYDLKSQ